LGVAKLAILRCTVCGGELDVNPDFSVGVCKYCESTITFPKELDRKGNLYNRAVFLRQNNEFDKAVSAYEDILKEDNDDAEAHWGLVLSKFGIEYVQDPLSGERLPTCHRTQSESILSDTDYLASLEFADDEAQEVFEKEACRINEIQAKILEISQKEPPYDIFICYKETDESGNRTKDSTLAQELFYELAKKGYKVFFARKTLESKLGSEYEPIIFSALNSARLMIVLGTRPEHFNAVWVRNEWSRFLKLAKNSKKAIIPAYRDMSPYELPAELSSLQSQDMSKIGFMQDLTDGIERIMTRGSQKFKEPAAPAYSSTPLERLIKNSETYLKLGNYVSAEEVYTKVTKEYPEDYRGWWGLIVCKTKSFSIVLLDMIALDVWFGYVKQLAEPGEFAKLEEIYIDYTKKVADLTATEDMKLINLEIGRHNKKIQELQSQAVDTENEKRKCTLDFGNTSVEDNLRISQNEKNLNKQEALYAKYKAKRFTGGIATIFGIVFLFMGEVGGVIGMLIGLIGIFIFAGAGKNGNIKSKSKDYKRNISAAQGTLDIEVKNKRDHLNKHEISLKDFDQKAMSLQQEIGTYQDKINNCKKYFALGKEKISSLFFAQKCSEIGVAKSYDKSIEVLRNAAYGVNTQETAEVVYISCPACGESIAINKDDIAGGTSVICNTCGNTIEISIGNGDQYSDCEESAI
jgi:tetratricopeptide (TPR) repeat protein